MFWSLEAEAMFWSLEKPVQQTDCRSADRLWQQRCMSLMTSSHRLSTYLLAKRRTGGQEGSEYELF
ncbi:hypothetical protein CRUP_028713 [Coryphaenoides rupestris]|nr:hypothetical protein CRUP_028713 [Coryphaenoides rupestris]